jgi:hypothetical protein
MKTISKILNKEFDFQVNHLGLFLNDDLWIHDKYIVLIDEQDFEYSRGIGHRVVNYPLYKKDFQRVMNKTPQKNKANLLIHIDNVKAVSKPKPLNIDDVLYSLILDSQAGQGTFEDFCDNFGYNEDSIKHSEIYKACQKTAKKVKTFIPNLEEASELFQDY